MNVIDIELLFKAIGLDNDRRRENKDSSPRILQHFQVHHNRRREQRPLRRDISEREETLEKYGVMKGKKKIVQGGGGSALTKKVHFFFL